MARCLWIAGGKRGRSEGAPETIDAGRVTGERLAQDLPCREAARVTSERSGVVTRAAIPETTLRSDRFSQ